MSLRLPFVRLRCLVLEEDLTDLHASFKSSYRALNPGDHHHTTKPSIHTLLVLRAFVSTRLVASDFCFEVRLPLRVLLPSSASFQADSNPPSISAAIFHSSIRSPSSPDSDSTHQNNSSTDLSRRALPQNIIASCAPPLAGRDGFPVPFPFLLFDFYRCSRFHSQTAVLRSSLCFLFRFSFSFSVSFRFSVVSPTFLP